MKKVSHLDSGSGLLPHPLALVPRQTWTGLTGVGAGLGKRHCSGRERQAGKGFVTPSGSTKVAQEELPLQEEGRRSGPTSGPACSSLNLWKDGLAAPVTAGQGFPSHWGRSLRRPWWTGIHPQAQILSSFLLTRMHRHMNTAQGLQGD